MHPKHLPKSYLTAPLLLTLLAACGGGAGGGTSVVNLNLFPESAGKPGANVVQPGQVKPEGSPNSGGAGEPGKQAGDQQGGNAGSANAGGRGDGAESAGQDSSGNGGTGNAGGGNTGSSAPSGGNSSGGTTGEIHVEGNPIATEDDESLKRISAADCPLQYERPKGVIAEYVGADPLLKRQWYLENRADDARYPGMRAGEDLRVTEAWKGGLDGDGVRVAVVDDGLLVLHEDLRSNVAPGSHNYRKGGHPDFPLPCDSDESHGTAVAGIIAARNGNARGISGVAPRASLVGLNAPATGNDADTLNALSRDLDKNHIFNNSWGNLDMGHFYGHENPAIRSVLNEGLTKGRNGLGSIYVFAGGNGATDTDYSILDSYVGERGVITVCASTAEGYRAIYSERGPNLTVCAPSADPKIEPKVPGVLTTIPADNNDSDLGEYMPDFDGTSAAAPMVSGVVALMLQANPKLTWRDVPLILARTARQVDAQDGGWTHTESPISGLSSAWNTLHYSHSYGFGVVNAEEATKLARSWQSVGGSSTQKKCVTGPVSVNKPIPEADVILKNRDGNQGVDREGRTALLTNAKGMDYNMPVTGGLDASLSVGNDCGITHIEHIDVTFNTTNDDGNGTHPSLGDLHVTLQSPSKTVSTLTIPHGCEDPYSTKEGELRIVTALCRVGGRDFQFGVRRHLEEPVAVGDNRTWTLSVADRVSGHTGRLKDWSITFYGR